MKPMDELMDEHRVIERVLNTLEVSANLMESGVTVRPEFLLSAADFIRGYADGCHHTKEEGVLFAHMAEQGIPLQGCPLGVMLAEHECGRQYTRALTSAAQALQSGDSSGTRRAIQSSRSYVALLRQHIYKEDNILFPMAENVIPIDQHDLIQERFDQVEHEDIGVDKHQKYLSLAIALEQEISTYS
jgi:hemerythrin-like domain-containing protein